MGYGLHVFKAQVGMFEPTQLQDQFVRIRYLADVFYRKVVFLESYPPFTGVNAGALAANATSAVTNITNIDMPDDEFGLFRWFPIDPISVRFHLPRGIDKFALKNITVPVDQKTLQWDPNLVSTEFATWEDNRPAVTVTNLTARAINNSRIVFVGYRFVTQEVGKDWGATVPAPGWWMERNQGKVWNMLESLKAGVQPATDVWCTGRSI